MFNIIPNTKHHSLNQLSPQRITIHPQNKWHLATVAYFNSKLAYPLDDWRENIYTPSINFFGWVVAKTWTYESTPDRCWLHHYEMYLKKQNYSSKNIQKHILCMAIRVIKPNTAEIFSYQYDMSWDVIQLQDDYFPSNHLITCFFHFFFHSWIDAPLIYFNKHKCKKKKKKSCTQV
jgi:hypothetical protein